MAQEWQSLLQQAPNIQNLDLAGTFTKSYQDALSTRKNAYDFYRTQKAQEIAAKASRPDGSMDWDTMFKLGNEAGLGLDAFEQVQKMQAARRASELAVQQQRMSLESMGYDPTKWDPSAGPSVAVKAGGTPYEGPSANDYGFVTGPEEIQIPQAPAQQFGAQGVGGTAQTSMAPSAPVAPVAQDVVGDNQVVVSGTATPVSKAPMFQLPAPEMRDPDQLVKTEGYYNELWRAQRDPEAIKRLLGSVGGSETSGPTLSTQQMKPEELSNLARYTALRGIAAKDPQEALTALENMAVGSVAVPQLNPMLGMLSKDEQAKEWGRYNTAIAEYPAKIQEARNKLSEAIRTGNYDVLEKQIAVAGNERAEEQNRRDREQVEWPEIFSKPFESPTEKANARQASASAQGISDAVRALRGMSPNDPKFPAKKMAVAKDIMIAYGLPVTEGVMMELEGLVNNGVSGQGLVDALTHQGFGGAVANGISQLFTSIAGTKDPNTIADMGRSAQEFAHRKYAALGVANKAKFNQAFPITDAPSADSWQSASPAQVLPNAPKAPARGDGKPKERTGWYKDADGVMRKH